MDLRETSVPERNIHLGRTRTFFDPEVCNEYTIASAPKVIADRTWPDTIIPECLPLTAIVDFCWKNFQAGSVGVRLLANGWMYN